MRRGAWTVAVVAAALPIAAQPAVAQPAVAQQLQTDASYTWSERVAAGHTVRVQNVNGAVIVGESTGDKVEISATKRWRRGDPSLVRIETTLLSDGSVRSCAIWDDRPSCDEREARRTARRTNRDNDVSVEFRVLVPRGVKLDVGTVNGGVMVDGVSADVDASIVNGEITVTTTGGRVNASSVNGGITARLGRIDTDGSMEFSTVNGNVTLEVPADFGGDVDLSTVFGSLNTNFEITLRGRIDRRELRTHVGRAGGPRIKLETVHGNVEIRKR